MNKNGRYMVIVTTILVLMLAGCSSAKTEEVKEEPVVTVQEEVNEVKQETEVETVAQEVAEIESTEVEEEPEATVPEGVDLESELPGEEWIKSFIGKVNEPVVVVYSDVTGRKEVIHDGDKIHINPDEDMVGVFFSEGCERGNSAGIMGTEHLSDEYTTFELDSERMRDEGVIEAKVRVLTQAEDWLINFRIIVD